MIICHKCKSILSPGSSYCSQCGSRITQEDYVEEPTGKTNPVYLKPGTILRMQYRINGVIGQGGFGITYDGTDIKLNMHVAIKEYFPNNMATRQVTVSTEVICGDNTKGLYEQGMKNFLKEAQNMAKFAGEDDFVSVHDFFPENNTAYIIMEFVEGWNLKQYLQQKGRFTFAEVMPIVMPVMNALEKIHAKNMIHRDVSPSNIMILSDGRVRLLDFGAARDVSMETNMTTMSAVYKYGYSPIEQLTTGMKQGPFTDIYALCATIYEMLTGTIPPSPFTRLYESDNLVPPSRMGVAIDADRENAIMKGLAVRGSDRIQSIAELRNALCGAYSANFNTQPVTPAPYQDNSGGGKLRVALIGALAFLVTLLVVMGGSVLFGRKPAGNQTAGPIAPNSSAEEQTEPDMPEEQQTAEVQQQAEPAAEEQETNYAKEAESVAPIQTNNGGGKSESIPDDAVEIGGNYYKVYARDNVHTWQQAEDYCESLGGHLAVITSDSVNDELYRLCLSSGYKSAFFGFSDAVSEGHWRWVTSSQPGYRNWGPSEPNSASYAEDYAMFSTTEKNGEWNDSEFGYETNAFICQWGDHGITDDKIDVDIPAEAVVYNGHSYYIFDNGMTSWAEAQQYCMSRGGDMAVINDAEENEFLYRYMRSLGYKYVFFGYTDKENEGDWDWVTSDTSDFEDWGMNDEGEREPNNDHPYEDYAEFSTEMRDGYWNDCRFGQDTSAYICEWNTTR